MVFLSWQITLVALVLLPVFLLPARSWAASCRAVSRQAMELNAQMNTTMTERFNVAGALLVKLFGRLGDEERQFSGKAGQVRDIGVTQAMYGRVFFTGLTLTASLATALVYGVGGLLVLDANITLGTLVALAALLSRLYGPLTALSNVQVDIMTALVSFDRVFEVLDLPPMVAEKPDAALPAVRGRSSSATCRSNTPRPTRSRSPRSSRWPSSTRHPASRCCSTCPSPCDPAR